MIEFDALYVLLLAELLTIFVALTVALFFRTRKFKNLYQAVALDLDAARRALSELNGRITGGPEAAAEEPRTDTVAAADTEVPSPSDVAKKNMLRNAIDEREALVGKLRSVEDALTSKNRLYDELKTKYENLEKEYLILYRHQQEQQKD